MSVPASQLDWKGGSVHFQCSQHFEHAQQLDEEAWYLLSLLASQTAVDDLKELSFPQCL